MKYTYLEMAEMDFRFAHLSSSIQLLKNKNYGTKKNLSSMDVHVLSYIEKNRAITLTQLSEYMLRAKSTLSPVVNYLFEDNLIAKEQNDNDRRSFGLIITEKGQEVLKKHYEYNQKLYASFSKFIIEKYGENYLDTYYDIVRANTNIVEQGIKEKSVVTGENLKNYK